jgi:collagen type V/XI/XXIV/XXVII alpha
VSHAAAVEAKLAEAEALESQIAAIAAHAQTVEQRIAKAARRGDSAGKSASEKSAVRGYDDDVNLVEKLDREMELLGRKVEGLRVEADDEFSRSLAERESEGGELKRHGEKKRYEMP